MVIVCEFERLLLWCELGCTYISFPSMFVM
jgi:hypothetical protein